MDTTTAKHIGPGYLIAGQFYPTPTEYRLGDPVLVRELTGMEFTDFCEALDDPRTAGDPVLSIGLIGVAVWQKFPKWSRQRAVEWVTNLPGGAVEWVAGPDTDGPEAAGPPAVAGEETDGALLTSPATSPQPSAAPSA